MCLSAAGVWVSVKEKHAGLLSLDLQEALIPLQGTGQKWGGSGVGGGCYWPVPRQGRLQLGDISVSLCLGLQSGVAEGPRSSIHNVVPHSGPPQTAPLHVNTPKARESVQGFKTGGTDWGMVLHPGSCSVTGAWASPHPALFISGFSCHPSRSSPLPSSLSDI